MSVLHWLTIGVGYLLGFFAAVRALLYKRNPSSALGWIAVCLIFPFIGAFLYFLFGINRIRTRAKKLETRSPFTVETGQERPVIEEEYSGSNGPVHPDLSQIFRISETVTHRPVVGGNRVQMLHNGEEAYPSMLEAIEKAERTLFLATYIFDTDRTGREFMEALTRAAERGVDVRVLIDGVGEFYSFPRAGTLLKRKGIKVGRFLPPKVYPPTIHINLRNHRKILSADSRMGFVGGMNIGDRHLAQNAGNPSRVVDVQFRVEGPVVQQLETVFLEDWAFCTGEQTAVASEGAAEVGNVISRTIVEGPNEDLDKLAIILMGAMSSAKHRISIMTPYFLPSREIISQLQVAALRGVEVNIVLPSKNNLPFVHWATRNMLWELLQRGVRVYFQPPPFVHSKLFVVDDHYAQIGSANLDPRSLRLNFELVMEIYDKATATNLGKHVTECQEKSRETSLEEMDSRSIPARMRDAAAWLFSPYL